MADVNTTVRSIVRLYTQANNTTHIFNSTATQSGLDETSAAWYIFTVVGFFGVVIFILMVSNLVVNRDGDEADPYYQYIEKQSKKKEILAKLSTAKLVNLSRKVRSFNQETRKTEESKKSPTDGPTETQVEEQLQDIPAGANTLRIVEVNS